MCPCGILQSNFLFYFILLYFILFFFMRIFHYHNLSSLLIFSFFLLPCFFLSFVLCPLDTPSNNCNLRALWIKEPPNSRAFNSLSLFKLLLLLLVGLPRMNKKVLVDGSLVQGVEGGEVSQQDCFQQGLDPRVVRKQCVLIRFHR